MTNTTHVYKTDWQRARCAFCNELIVITPVQIGKPSARAADYHCPAGLAGAAGADGAAATARTACAGCADGVFLVAANAVGAFGAACAVSAACVAGFSR